MLGDARHGAAALVGDAQGERALLARALQHQVGVGGFARLRDPDHQRIAIIDARFVERGDGGRGQRDRDSGGDLQQIAAEQRGVIAGAAGHQDDQARALLLDQPLEFFDAAQFGGERALQRFRLLPDLFEHTGH